MKNRSISVPAAMLARKFYCHRCAEQLTRQPRTRIIKRGDPDYKEYSRIGRTHMIGDVELTEYEFKCPSCGTITPYDEQCVIEKIQQHVGRHPLSQAEIAEHTQNAKAALEREKKRRTAIVKVLGILLTVLALIYVLLTSGEFSFYF